MSHSPKFGPPNLEGARHWLHESGTSLAAWNWIFHVVCKRERVQSSKYNKFLKIDGIMRYHKFDVWDNHLSERSNRDVNLQLPYL